jgi:hypothetical protein
MKRRLIDNISVQPLLDPTVTPLSAGTTATTFIDAQNFISASVMLAVGEALGSPTAQSVTVTLQTADDASGTNAENLLDLDGNAITIELTADNLNSFVDAAIDQQLQYLGASVVTAFTGGTSVSAAAATGVLTFSGVVADGQTVTIGTDVYEFDTDASVTAGNILVDVSGGATAADAVTALVAAVTASGDGTYSAADGAGDTVDVTYGTTGTTGNSVATTETCTNGAWGAVTLTGGVDASPSIPVNIVAVLGDPKYTRDI